MYYVKLIVDLAAAACAFGAAAFWWIASNIGMPADGRIQFVHPDFENAVLSVTRRQSYWNSWAARVAAVAAVLTGISVLIGTRWG